MISFCIFHFSPVQLLEDVKVITSSQTVGKQIPSFPRMFEMFCVWKCSCNIVLFRNKAILTFPS